MWYYFMWKCNPKYRHMGKLDEDYCIVFHIKKKKKILILIYGIKFSPFIQLFNTPQQTLTFHAIVVIQTNHYTYKNNSFFFSRVLTNLHGGWCTNKITILSLKICHIISLCKTWWVSWVHYNTNSRKRFSLSDATKKSKYSTRTLVSTTTISFVP